MQDLEKRIENIEKKLNIENSTVLTENEKIVWDFIFNNLPYLFEIHKSSKNLFTINATGFRYGIDTDTNSWAEDKNKDLIEAFLSLGAHFYEKKDKE